MNELISPTGRRTIINALLTLPHDWDGQRTAHVRTTDDVEAMMTVAPEIQADLRAAATRHAQHADRVTLHTDETGLHIVAINVTPADELEPHAYLLEASRAAPAWCDAVAHREGVTSWADLVHGLKFDILKDGPRHLGLHSLLPSGHALFISDSGQGVPRNLAGFQLTHRALHLTVRDGRAA
ncbi:hypothetical protein [Deinococcus aquaticus]|uniref:Uncharacterized protein n=1 Tax=Deinococcus aquaticus TaxID=328692 RepID=A0ABY7V673_9DEIO|nr:hypothetical protein [Deinococcus aquaticus]WDA60707.1 hypothetical protein M8445_17215 [Deinococcus aquaticus]